MGFDGTESMGLDEVAVPFTKERKFETRGLGGWGGAAVHK